MSRHRIENIDEPRRVSTPEQRQHGRYEQVWGVGEDGERSLQRKPVRNRRRDAIFSAIGVFGELLLTLGIVLLLFVVYEAYWTNIQSGQEQAKVDKQLEDEWSGAVGSGTPGDGSAIGRIYIPSFGSDWEYAIVQGTSAEDLSKGPGHYTESQNPGEKGNFAVAGHRVGRGAPFNDLNYLDTCKPIIIETRDKWFIYRVLPVDEAGAAGQAELSKCVNDDLAREATSGQYESVRGRSVTTPGDVSTIAPVPNIDDSTVEQATLPILTLTTCHPQFSNAKRMIIHAVLERSEDRQGDKKPAEMAS